MKRFVRSVVHAVRGIGYTLRNERNFQVELAVAITVLCLMFWFPLSHLEDILLLIVTALVLILELVNTALERVMDILKPRVHPYARVVKDVMAGAVFIASCGAFIVGVIIFTPYMFR